jgi:hypothetical protein
MIKIVSAVGCKRPFLHATETNAMEDRSPDCRAHMSTLAGRRVASDARQNGGSRDRPTVHQRLGKRGGGSETVVRSRIGDSRIPGGDEQSQSLTRKMPSMYMSDDADKLTYNQCANSDMPSPLESPKTGNRPIAEAAAVRPIAGNAAVQRDPKVEAAEGYPVPSPSAEPRTTKDPIPVRMQERVHSPPVHANLLPDQKSPGNKKVRRHAEQIRLKKMRRTALKASQDGRQKEADFQTEIAQDSEAVAAARNCSSVQVVLAMPEYIPTNPRGCQNPSQVVRPSVTPFQRPAGVVAKRIVLQSAVVAATSQARLLAAVKQRAETPQGNANRVAIARCAVDAECKTGSGLSTGDAGRKSRVGAPSNSVVVAHSNAVDQDDQDGVAGL